MEGEDRIVKQRKHSVLISNKMVETQTSYNPVLVMYVYEELSNANQYNTMLTIMFCYC